MEQRPKGSGEQSIAGKCGKLAKLSSIERKGKIRMVKATLPEPQLEVELMASSHDSLRAFREVGGSERGDPMPQGGSNTSQPSRTATDKWWQRAKREPKRIASLSKRKRGIA